MRMDRFGMPDRTAESPNPVVEQGCLERPNSALVTDACGRRCRALFSAAQRGR
jgi:hypothetical protein